MVSKVSRWSLYAIFLCAFRHQQLTFESSGMFRCGSIRVSVVSFVNRTSITVGTSVCITGISSISRRAPSTRHRLIATSMSITRGQRVCRLVVRKRRAPRPPFTSTCSKNRIMYIVQVQRYPTECSAFMLAKKTRSSVT